MENRAFSSIREIVRLAFIGTLAMFFIAEAMPVQDAISAHPVIVLAISSVAAVLWYWGQDRRVP
jgi:hypothetical protein